MSQTIPGGRQRSSSDGDILDEDYSCSIVNSRSSSNIKEASDKKIPGRVYTKQNNKTDTSLRKIISDHSECDEVTVDSDGGISSHSSYGSSKSKRRNRRLSFKSMKKAVSRAFVKEGKTTPSSAEQNGKTHHQSVNIHEQGKIWTPDLRRLGKGQSNMSDTDSPRSISSSARPLITDPDLGMTIPKWKRTPGTIGLFNHANSCFMNAVLQCLSNTDSFTEYFIHEFYKRDLKQNKGGKKSTFRSSHGEVTEQLGHLLSSLWCGKYQGDISKAFKSVVAKVNNQYHGDDQHDSQEFLLWLLDRIHEDVYSISKKKIKHQKNSSLKSDEELAQEALAVNGESFIFKLFQALHSSTLTCPACGDSSRKFDPYLCVSLPLPQRSPRVMYVSVVYLEHHGRCVRRALVLNHFDTVRDFRESVADETGIPESQIILCQLTDDGFGATYSNEQPLSDIPSSANVYAIETHTDRQGGSNSDHEFDSPNAQVLVVHVEKSDNSQHRFGSPSLLKVSRDIRWKDLQREMLYHLDDAVCPEIFLQKLNNLFLMQVWDGSCHSGHLSMDVEMPLYTQAAESALDSLDEDFGPSHIKILAIWSPQTKHKVILDDREPISDHMSVREVMNNPSSLDTVSLDECFRLYTQEEKLIGEDAWMCPHCKQLQQGTVKSLGLWSLPDILILHLKRFKQTGLHRSKLNTLVDFPVDSFDMSPHVTLCNKTADHSKSDHTTYDLIGVCNHYGNMMGGHYTAFCRSPVDGKWREFNDTKVRVLDKLVVNKEAYILFYQRRSLSKDINQKLFTGDHWVFSLPLSVEDSESPSSEVSPRDGEILPRAHKNRSRSTSPSLRRQSNGPNRRLPLQPSTPQPTRRPAVLSFYDNDNEDEDGHTPGNSSSSSPEKPTTSRQSRPVHRQLSAAETIKRGASASAVKSPTRGSYEKRNDAEDAAFARSKIAAGLAYRESRDMENGISSKTKTPAVSVIRHSKQDSIVPPSSSSLQYRNEKSSPAFHVTTESGTDSPRQRGHYESNKGLESDAKYPPSVHIPSSHRDSSDKENRSGLSSYSVGHKVKDTIEPTVGLRVNLDHTHTSNSLSSSYQTTKPLVIHESSKPHPYDSIPTSTGEARRKLAELIRQSSSDKQNGHTYVTNKPTASTLTRRYQSQSSYDHALRHPINVGHHHLASAIDDLDLRGSDNLAGLDIPNARRTIYRPEDYNRSSFHPGDRSSYPPRQYAMEEDYDSLYSNGSRHDSSLRSRLDDSTFEELAQRHFGDPHPSIEAYTYSRDPLTSHTPSGSSSLYQKCATIARSREITPPYRHKEVSSPFPRSSTDQNIHYNTDLHSLAIPESSIHSYNSMSDRRADNRYHDSSSISSSRLTDREINSIRSYDSTWKRVSNPSRRYRPRGVWGVNPPQPTQQLASSKVPTPCLRESSV